MESLGLIRNRTQDLLHIQSNDTYHPAPLIDVAINDALIQSVDRLAGTTSRRRFMVRVPDLSIDPGFDDITLTWTLPANFRRPFKLVRKRAGIDEVEREEDFDTFGEDGYMVIGRSLELTKGTDPVGLAIWYVYTPPRMTQFADVPDWIEGYERFLSLEAAAIRSVKADVGSPETYRRESSQVWPYLILAARQSTLPASIRSAQEPAGETWY